MFLSNLFSTAEKNENIQILTPAEFKTALENPSVQLLDVRTPNEFAAGSIQGAKKLESF